jgi:hypothetical protein
VQIAEGVHTRYPNRTSISMAYDVDLIRSLVAAADLEEVGLIEGRIHIPLDRRPGLEEIRRERRRRLVGRRLAEEGVDDAVVSEALAAQARPTVAEVDAPALYHPCDVLALRKGNPPR